MKKKLIDAPTPLIVQSWASVKSGRKHVTEVTIGPHVITIVAYPNRGYYVLVNGTEVFWVE